MSTKLKAVKRPRRIKLFPYALVRVASGEITELSQLNIKKTNLIIEKQSKIQIELTQLKEEISEKLHNFIATISENKVRYGVIQLRRDIYNGEKNIALTPEMERLLPGTIKNLIARYQILKDKELWLFTKGEKYYEEEKNRSKKIFLKLLKNSNFQNGILLASNTLPESFTTYIHEKNKTLPKVERSLMKYLSRMYTKPSPFSTFTSLALATFGESDTFKSEEKTKKLKSHIELNHYLFHYIIGLLIQNKEIKRHLTIRLNPTIQLSQDQFFFIANNFNNESIQRITITPALQIIYTFILKRRQWVYNNLVNQLLQKQFTTVTQKEMEEYLDRLLLYGFLEYDFGIAGTDPLWDEKLVNLLTPLAMKFAYLTNLQSTLLALRKAAKEYEVASPKKRKTILTDAFTILKTTCLHLHNAAGLPKSERKSFSSGNEISNTARGHRKQKEGKENELFIYEYKTSFDLKQNQLWYEDTTINDSFLLGSHIKKKLAVIGNLLNRMGWFDECTEQIFELTDFFKRYYEISESVDFLEFYEKYHRRKKEKIRKGTIKNPSLGVIKKRNENYLHKFAVLLKERQLDGGSINITEKDISHIPKFTSSSSYGAYFHVFFKSNEEQQIVINITWPGFGKMYSRFLSLFSEKLTKTLYDWNSINEKEVLLAEATDASVFNANLHPSLMPYAIVSSGSYTMASKQRQILINDIEVVYNKDHDRIQLFHKTLKKEIIIFDLGLQRNKGRSELFEFLSYFSQGVHHHIHYLRQIINKELKKRNRNDLIRIYPRLTYEKNIILQRNKWEIKKDALPIRLPLETEWMYYQKVINWKNSVVKMPNEIFVVYKDDKPQYINFSNPFLVTIFAKMIEKVKEKEILQIEEMLPASDNLYSVNGKNFVTEFFAQWYC